MTATIFTNSIPSPASPIDALDFVMSPIPEGKLSASDRDKLKSLLDETREKSAKSQEAYNTAHASITRLQQLVLSTHAKVAEAKQAVLEAKGISSSNGSSASNSTPTSNASSPPSPSSPLNHLEDTEHEERLQKLEREHVDLGIKLSKALRDKAEAEETKKILSDYLMRAKQTIKELEQKLRE